MSTEDFFVNEEIQDIDIDGKIFKYKPMTPGEELDWLSDCMKDKEVVDEETGESKKIQVRDIGKQAILKFRNIMEVPFTDEELQKITGLSKKYKDYTVDEKDRLFRKLKGSIYSKLSLAIDNINNHSKKD